MGVAVVVSAVALTGCSSGAPAATSGPRPSASSAASAVATPGAVELHPNGSATDNLPYFTAVVSRVWGSESRGSARAYIDALTAAGFARADMQATADASTVGNPAESLQFSVRWGATECLVGQVGPSTGDPVTAVLPQLSGGRCLIGKTPPVGG